MLQLSKKLDLFTHILTTSLLVMRADTQPKVMRYKVGFCRYKPSGLFQAIRIAGARIRINGTTGDKTLVPWEETR